MFRKIRKGFTIVELVIVIAVIAVLTAILIPTIIQLGKKAKTASDQSLVANLNTALKMEQGETGKAPKTMHDAVEGLYNQGYVLDNLITKSEQDLVYSLAENKFYLSGEVTPSSDYWHIYKWDQIPSTQTWSIYASGSWQDMTGAKELKVGFDAGDTHGNYNLAFNNNAEGVKAIIRTNSANTNLSVYAPNGSVEHYGNVGSLEIIAVKDGSYHEYGSAGFAEINKGRIVLENDSEIKHIHINANSTSTGFEAVVIEDKGAEALPEAITRDEITLNSGSVDVVTVVSSGSEEVVKVYADGSTGSTQKTETQNTSVASALGQLVLDNGATDKKALDEDAKEEARYEAVDELAGEEIAEENQKGALYVARIGATGYGSFIDAVKAAKTGEKIRIVSDLFYIDEDIGSYGIGGLKNEVILDGNATVVFKNTARVFFKEGGAFKLNGHTLVATFDATCDATKTSGFLYCSLYTAYHGRNTEYHEYVLNDKSATIYVDFEYLNGVGSVGLVYHDWSIGNMFIGGAAGAGNPDNMPYDEDSAASTQYVDINKCCRIFVKSGADSYEWSIDREDCMEIKENHGSWVVLKGLKNPQPSSLEGGPVVVSLRVTKGVTVTEYSWTINVCGMSMDNPPWDF